MNLTTAFDRRVVFRCLMALLLLGAAAGILLLGTSIFGLVSGEEFAPDSFERRTYWYYELPIVHLKVTPVMRSVQRNELETMLTAKKYISSTTPPKRWDLIYATRGSRPWRLGDAQILSDYLLACDTQRGLTGYWKTWTIEHPELAKVLWPAIAELARQNVYLSIPAVFEKALEQERPAALQRDLDQLLATSYESLAKSESDAGRHSSAVRLFSAALRRQPGRVRCLAGRAACYDVLDEPAKAAADRQALESLAEEETRPEA